MENLFLKEKILDISSEAYLEDKGVEYLSLALILGEVMWRIGEDPGDLKNR